MDTKTIAVGVVLLVVLIGGAYLLRSGAGTGDTIRVGVIAPITGPAAAYGESMRNAMVLAAEQVNADGGIHGKTLELVIENGGCDGTTAASAMQKLASIDGVELVLGGFCSVESIAAEPIATSQKVMMLSPGSSSPMLTNVSKYFVRIYPSDSSQGTVLAVAAANLGLKKIAVLQEQTEYAAGVYSSFTTAFTEKGGTTVKEEFPTAATDFRSSLAKLQAEKPDGVFVVAQTQAAERLLFKQLQEIGWKGQILLNDVPAGDAELLAEFKDFLEGSLTAEFTADLSNPKYQEMLAAYQTRYDAEPANAAYAQTEWDVVFLAADALRAAGNNADTLSQWLRTEVKDWDGASGKITIGANGDPVVGHKLEMIREGAPVLYAQ